MHKVKNSLNEMESLGRYEDVAYLEGQLDAYFFLAASDEVRMQSPNYFVFGVDDSILTRDDFLEDAKRARKLHPNAYERAVKIVGKNGDAGLAIHHRPHLYC